jgi:pimeloyl-ACP methyl ester carboxylesterase
MVQMSRLPVRRLPVTSADGTRLAVTITGPATGGGPPLVVGPGSLATARDWQLVARALASRMTTYALDRRGHGNSGDHPAYSLGHEQDDLAAVIELAMASHPAGPTAGLTGGVTLLGHSYGGLIALTLAARLAGTALEPARLVLYEPPLALDRLPGGTALPEYARAVAAGDPDRALAIGLREFVRMPDQAIAAMRSQPIWARLSGMTPGWTREIAALDDYCADLAGDLGRFATLGIPVLLLMGELSPPWLTAASRRLAQFLPDVTVAELPGQAHDAHVFAPIAVAAEIARFALGDAPQP